MLADFILALIFFIGLAAILFWHSEKIETWAKSKNGKHIRW